AVPDHDELAPRSYRDPRVLLVVDRVRVHEEAPRERGPQVASEHFPGDVRVLPPPTVVLVVLTPHDHEPAARVGRHTAVPPVAVAVRAEPSHHEVGAAGIAPVVET